jgi:hypothetical protein
MQHKHETRSGVGIHPLALAQQRQRIAQTAQAKRHHRRTDVYGCATRSERMRARRGEAMESTTVGSQPLLLTKSLALQAIRERNLSKASEATSERRCEARSSTALLSTAKNGKAGRVTYRRL